MNEHDIGRLEGKLEMLILGFEDFRGEVRKFHEELNGRLSTFNRRVRSLEHLRWWLAGIGAAVLTLLGWIRWK